ncbi:MAG TPA: hypothetical protein VIV60_06910 [Polyangiaceae bacterium]
MIRKMVMVGMLALAACGGDGLGMTSAPDASQTIDARAAATSACTRPIVPRPTSDPCAFTLPTSAVGQRIDLYMSNQHQADASYIIDGTILTVVSGYFCTERVRDDRILLDVSVLIGCDDPPPVLD